MSSAQPLRIPRMLLLLSIPQFGRRERKSSLSGSARITINMDLEPVQLMGAPTPGDIVDQGVEDIDECALNSFLCGLEAGCQNTPGSFRCICSDLQPQDPDTGCRRGTTGSPQPQPESPSVKAPSPAHHPEAPVVPVTEGNNVVFHHLLEEWAPNKNSSEVRSSSDIPLSTAVGHQHLSSIVGGGPSALLVTIMAAAAASLLILLLTLGACALRKKAPHSILHSLCGRGRGSGGRRRRSSPPDLSKCLQQYVTNPNYYSGSPDAPWAKMLSGLEIPADALLFQQEIGEGFFGKVHKALYRNADGSSQPVAVKVLKEGASSEAQADFEREVEIMATFKHDNILKLLGVVLKEAGQTPWMVFEYMVYGDLAELLRRNSCSSWLTRSSSSRPGDAPYRLEKVDLVWIATQVASGMLYLSGQHFVHRDLASRNCLVGHNLLVKISDFGMARDIYTCDYYKIGGSRLLPVRWMAPESIMYGKFTLESDVWSYGVVLWEIFTYGKQPYYGHSNEEVIKLILQGVLLSPPEDCPAYISTIMAGCWRGDAKERLRFPDVYNRLLANCPYRNVPLLVDSPTDEDDYLLPNSALPV